MKKSLPVLVYPGVGVPRARPVPQLEPFPLCLPLGACAERPARRQMLGCFHWLLGLWVFVFPREVRWEEEDNRMLGFSFFSS